MVTCCLIADISVHCSKNDRIKMNNKAGGKGYAIRNLHAMLHVIFAELMEFKTMVAYYLRH
jgi:hypothetical protein